MDTFRRGEIAATSVVSAEAELGVGVTVGQFTVIHPGVRIGDGSVVGSHCVIGEPTSDFYGSNRLTDRRPEHSVIGDRALIRSHAVVYAGVEVGDDLALGHHVTIREGSIIGDDVSIGTQSDLQGHLTIGHHARLHSRVFVPQLTSIGEFVWLFPGVILTNDPHPPSDRCTQGPTIDRFAAVGAAATVLPGVHIGAHALVGAGSVVTRDVDPESLVVGSPATLVGSVRDVTCAHGAIGQVYPWPRHFRRGYPEGALPPPTAFD